MHHIQPICRVHIFHVSLENLIRILFLLMALRAYGEESVTLVHHQHMVIFIYNLYPRVPETWKGTGEIERHFGAGIH